MAVVSVAATSTLLLAKNNYQQVILSNRGTTTVWCEFTETAVVDSGFPLDGGDKIIIATTGTTTNLDLNAISESGNVDVSSYGS